MDNKVKKQIIDKIKDSNNVLVALNNSPTVDELSAALGITLAINKIDKHATAVFSGDIPAAIEFLEPEKTFENTVLSLQDFIIALDKEKADHLRYKVDGDMVKIFITPYRTTIDEGDLEFSQGDYNVDFVLAIGVQNVDSLDKALQSHGQILDDATVASISLNEESALGSINWNDKNASSYSEILTSVVKDLRVEKDVLDEQIATALLTGIVAATDRFSNEKTSSRVMTTAAELMTAGANQQLIAVQLEQAQEISASQPVKNEQRAEPIPEDTLPPQPPAEKAQHDGELSINHELKGNLDEVTNQVEQVNQTAAAREAESELGRQLHPAYEPMLPTVQPTVDYEETPMGGGSIHHGPQAEPTLGGTLNATTEEAAEDKRREIERDQNHTILSHDTGHYITEKPSYQAPISAAVDAAQNDEPQVRDIFADNTPMAALPQPAPTIHDLHAAPVDPMSTLGALPPPPGVQPAASTVSPFPNMTPAMAQPPMAAGSAASLAFPLSAAPDEPTLAEIDAQNRSHTALLGDVHAAFGGQSSQPAFGGLPPLPPLPPMPDMGTLPPLPGANQAFPTASQNNPFGNNPGVQGEPLGSMLPPAPTVPDSGKTDPGQFKIPGMS